MYTKSSTSFGSANSLQVSQFYSLCIFLFRVGNGVSDTNTGSESFWSSNLGLGVIVGGSAVGGAVLVAITGWIVYFVAKGALSKSAGVVPVSQTMKLVPAGDTP